MKVSIITAVYNRAATIRQAIESVQSQTHGHIEHIVIDGASTDGTVEIIGEYGSDIDVFVSEPDDGIYHALNKGLSRATGDIVGFLHADDTFGSSSSIASIVSAFSDPQVAAAYGDLVYVSSTRPGRIVRYWRAGNYEERSLRRGWMPPHPTFYVRREVYEQLGLFDTTYRIAGDYEWVLRFFIQANRRVAYVPEVLVHMQTGGVSNSVPHLLVKMGEDFRALREHGLSAISALVWKNASKVLQFVAQESPVK